MQTPLRSEFRKVSPDELLGRPLNDVERKNAPDLLHVGTGKSLPLPGPRVAIVGSRKASARGIETASDLASFLGSKSIVIVSGLAEGIDTAAHESAIEHGGSTVAVIGTPLNRSYPAKNAELQEAIMAEHWLISEFQQGSPTRPRNFVMRDKTMALISDASIIVEAGESSGALYEGWETLRLGRPLYIWKDIFENAPLKWPKKMLEYGAVELSDPEDVLQFLPSSEPILKISL